MSNQKQMNLRLRVNWMKEYSFKTGLVEIGKGLAARVTCFQLMVVVPGFVTYDMVRFVYQMFSDCCSVFSSV